MVTWCYCSSNEILLQYDLRVEHCVDFTLRYSAGLGLGLTLLRDAQHYTSVSIKSIDSKGMNSEGWNLINWICLMQIDQRNSNVIRDSHLWRFNATLVMHVIFWLCHNIGFGLKVIWSSLKCITIVSGMTAWAGVTSAVLSSTLPPPWTFLREDIRSLSAAILAGLVAIIYMLILW